MVRQTDVLEVEAGNPLGVGSSRSGGFIPFLVIEVILSGRQGTSSGRMHRATSWIEALLPEFLVCQRSCRQGHRSVQNLAGGCRVEEWPVEPDSAVPSLGIY